MGRRHFRSSDIYDVVTSNIKKHRKAAGLTQEQVADKTGYSHEFIRRVEAPNCKKNFTIESLNIIAQALGVHISVLFETKKESDD